MSNPGDADDTPLTSVRQMADYLAAGLQAAGRSSASARSTRNSAFACATSRRRLICRPMASPAASATCWPGWPSGGEPILDGDNAIGLKQGGASVSLEPAGQLELSGAPLETLHDTTQELRDPFRAGARRRAKTWTWGSRRSAFIRRRRATQMPWMPKGRYAIMQRYMPLVGGMGLDMMTRTCTVQVNLDYASEQDMRRKLRVSLLLQPLATALFANSPFTEGKPNGFLSYRAHVWTDTDNQRSGIPKVMFEDGFGFERYAAWLIEQVPMYFVYRDGRYIDVAGQSFADFMAGRIPALAGVTATMGDFADHVTTAFTDVRLKRFLEMRGADAGQRRHDDGAVGAVGRAAV